MGRKKKEDELDFERSLKRLEEIVKRLEEEQVPLEESLRLYAEGRKLARACEQGLSEAENRVKMIIEDADGNLKDTTLDAEDAAESDDSESAADKSAPAAPKKRDDLPF